jgi:HAMP domain-containing protein
VDVAALFSKHLRLLATMPHGETLEFAFEMGFERDSVVEWLSDLCVDAVDAQPVDVTLYADPCYPQSDPVPIPPRCLECFPVLGKSPTHVPIPLPPAPYVEESTTPTVFTCEWTTIRLRQLDILRTEIDAFSMLPGVWPPQVQRKIGMLENDLKHMRNNLFRAYNHLRAIKRAYNSVSDAKQLSDGVSMLPSFLPPLPANLPSSHDEIPAPQPPTCTPSVCTASAPPTKRICYTFH